MSRELVISAAPHETRVSIIEDGQLCEIYIEREKEFALVGSIYKGRVTRVLPGMQSAFVEIGLDSDAFLYVGDFLENLEDYDHVSAAVEGKVEKMEQQGGAVFAPPAAGEGWCCAGRRWRRPRKLRKARKQPPPSLRCSPIRVGGLRRRASSRRRVPLNIAIEGATAAAIAVAAVFAAEETEAVAGAEAAGSEAAEVAPRADAIFHPRNTLRRDPILRDRTNRSRPRASLRPITSP